MLHYLRVGLRITITHSHTHTMQQTRTHKAVTQRVEAKKVVFLFCFVLFCFFLGGVAMVLQHRYFIQKILGTSTICSHGYGFDMP